MATRPDPVDVHVGKRLRLRRVLQGMSQQKLAEAVGLTFQQVQKYERGVNRIGASRLFQLAQVLDVPISYFFDDMSGEAARGALPGFAETGSSFEGAPMGKREALELVRAYARIRSPELRRRLFDLAKILAELGEGEREGAAS